jgi:zinc D-Ala-D-Ala carboxypeptidase
MNLSPNFTLDELTHTEQRNMDNTPNDAELENLVRLAEFLEQVKEVLGGKPIIVNSAFRSKAVNDAVGSKDSSQHRRGCAADIRVPGMKPDEVVRAIIEAGLPYDQVIREFDRWTHVSIPNTSKIAPINKIAMVIRISIFCTSPVLWGTFSFCRKYC